MLLAKISVLGEVEASRHVAQVQVCHRRRSQIVHMSKIGEAVTELSAIMDRTADQRPIMISDTITVPVIRTRMTGIGTSLARERGVWAGHCAQENSTMSGIYTGSLSRSSISCVIDDLLCAQPSLQWAIIRSIDSATSLDDVRRILNFHHTGHTVNNDNVILSRDELVDAIEKEVFTGYDEMWLFDEYPTSLDLTNTPIATSDVELFAREVPDKLRTAVSRTRCRLLLADGMGLNFASPDVNIVAILKQLNEN